MSIESVRAYFRERNMEDRVLEFAESSATVELAALALGCEPKRIAKTLAFSAGERAVLVVAAGDARVDNRKFKAQFGAKPRMLTSEEVLERTGHAIGGVCPFAVKDGVEVFLDVSLKRFATVFPACGSGNSAIELGTDELEQLSLAKSWVDVCKDWE